MTRGKSTMVEKVIMSWLPSQANCILGTVFTFAFTGKNRRFLYFYVPDEWDSRWTFSIFVLLELMNITAGAGFCIFLYYIHTFFIRSMIFWTGQK